MDSYYYVRNLIYNENEEYKPPTAMIDLSQTIQMLVFLYKDNPDWPETLREDMKQYVMDCIDLLEKV